MKPSNFNTINNQSVTGKPICVIALNCMVQSFHKLITIGPYFGLSKHSGHFEKTQIPRTQNTIIRKISIPRYLQLYTIVFKVLVFLLPFCQDLCSAVLADKDLASPEIRHRPFLVLFSSMLYDEE